MRKAVFVALSLALCVSVASANRDFDDCHKKCNSETGYEYKLRECE